MSNVIPVDPRPNLMAGARPQAIVPQDMDSAYRLAKAVCLAGMAPKGMETPEKCMIAIMRGMEVGMTPFMALDKIAIVNGRPLIWGDGAMGLVRGSGLCEWIKERVEGEGDNRVGVCEAKRKGEPEPIRRTFSVADAKRASLWGKSGPWQQYPERMLTMRARAFCLRDGFADVLGGLYLKEEFDGAEGYSEPVQTRPAAPTPPTPPKPPARVIEHHPAAPDPVAKAVESVQQHFPGAEVIETRKSEPEFIDWEAVVREFEEAAAVARDEGTLNEVWDDLVLPYEGKMPAPDWEKCDAVYRKRLGAIAP